MSRSLNKVMLIGNVGNDPEIRATSSGARVAKLSLATNRSWSDRSGQQQEKTEWHRLTFFGRLVDIVEQWVKKGDRLYVEGRIEYSQTQDDQGVAKYWTDVVIQEMVMLGSNSGGGAGGGGGSFTDGGTDGGPSGGGGGGATGGGAAAPPMNEPDDDLPF
jgi:single-strand DNA-binding protein